MNRALLATGSAAVAVWVNGPDQLLIPGFNHQLDQIYSGSRSSSALAVDQRELSSLRRTGHSTALLTSATSRTMVCQSLTALDQSIGVLVFYRPADEVPSITKSFQDLIAAIAEIVIDYEKNFALQTVQQQLAAQRTVAGLALQLNESRSSTALAYVIANDGRQLVGCDRISVFKYGGGARHVATSGVAKVDRRSRDSRRMTQLVSRTMRDGKPMVYSGQLSELPRRVRPLVEPLVRENNLQLFSIVPLRTRPGFWGSQRVTGALSAEFVTPADAATAWHKLEILHAPCQCRLGEPVSGRAESVAIAGDLVGGVVFAVPTRPAARTVLVLLMLAGGLAALALVKDDFEIEVAGELTPVAKPHVWAPIDGIVKRVLVQHGADVTAGQVVAELDSPELQLEVQKVQGQLQSARRRRDGFNLSLKQAELARADPSYDQLKLSAEIAETETEIENLSGELQFIKQQQEKLTIRSPIAGQVITWNVNEQLMNRPVRRGESLMVIGDTAGKWHVEFLVPDKKMRYIGEAQSEFGPQLPIDCLVAADPNNRFAAKIESVSAAASMGEGNAPEIKIKADFDLGQVQFPRVGLSVVGRIHCGRRSLLYIWTYEFVDAVRRRFFW